MLVDVTVFGDWLRSLCAYVCKINDSCLKQKLLGGRAMLSA